MAPTSSKELTPEEEAERKERYKRDAAATLAVVGPLTFAIVTGGQLLNQSRPMLVRKIVNDDLTKAAAMLATFASYGGILEFALNPVIGRLSDCFGRRPLLLLSPITCSILRGLVALFPSSPNLIMVERMLSSAVVTGFFSTMRAMLNDTLEGKDLIVGMGAFSAWAGSGVILGPYVEVLILKLFGPRANFAAVSLLNAVVGLIMYMKAKETLPMEDRKTVTLKDCSPFTFVEMFQVSSVNRKFMLILLLQSFGEGRIMQDINMLFLREQLEWMPEQISTFMSLLGVSVVAGGKTVALSLDKFGMYGHTRLSNLAMALAFYVQAFGGRGSISAKYVTQYIALSLWFVGGRKRDALETLCTAETLGNTTMGKGQVSSALSNFKSIGAIFGPVISAKAFSYGLKTNSPGFPYKLIAACYICAELLHSTMGKKEMGIKEGQ